MIALASLLVWIYLCCAHGKFWLSAARIGAGPARRAR